MKAIPLSRNKVALVDDADYDHLTQYNWSFSSHGYAVHNWRDREAKKWRTRYMHREVMHAERGQIVDHINGDKLDNRRDNLRFATAAQNMRNRPGNPNSQCPYKGVSIRKNGRFYAYITVEGKQLHLGTYDEARTAARVYDAAARRFYGDFARLNVPEEPPDAASETLMERGLNKHTRGMTPLPYKVHKATSDYLGVTWQKGYWRARTPVGKRPVSLGLYVDDAQAAIAVDMAKMVHDPYGATLNFPDDWEAYKQRLQLQFGDFPVDVDTYITSVKKRRKRD